jgi:ribokinase
MPPNATNKSWDVVVLGGLNTDFLVRSEHLPGPGQTVQGDPLYTGPGGKGANQAVAAARLGGRVAMIGRVGEDRRGRDLLAALRRNGVDVKHVERDSKEQSGAAIIAVNDEGEKQISSAPAANMRLTVQQVLDAEDLIARAKVLLLQLEVPMPATLKAAQLAKKYGTKVVLDPAPPTTLPKQLFPLLYAIRPNSDEAEKITGKKIRNPRQAKTAGLVLLKRGVQVVALQAGDEGDLILSASEEILVPRLKVKTVDATGAGDAFAAAFAMGLAEGLSLRRTAHLANATAALSTTRIGAQEALPTRTEVERFLQKHSRQPS